MRTRLPLLMAATAAAGLVLAGCSSTETASLPTGSVSPLADDSSNVEPDPTTAAEPETGAPEAAEPLDAQTSETAPEAFVDFDTYSEYFPTDTVTFKDKKNLSDGWQVTRTAGATMDGSSATYNYRVEFDPATLTAIDSEAKKVKNAESPVVCLARTDGMGSSCTTAGASTSLSLPNGSGAFDLLVKRSFEAEQGRKITTLTMNASDAPAAAQCTISGGEAVREGNDFTVTVKHSGDCTPGTTYIPTPYVLFTEKGKNVDVSRTYSTSLPALNGRELSHSASETVLQFSIDPSASSQDLTPLRSSSVSVQTLSRTDGFAGNMAYLPVGKSAVKSTSPTDGSTPAAISDVDATIKVGDYIAIEYDTGYKDFEAAMKGGNPPLVTISGTGLVDVSMTSEAVDAQVRPTITADTDNFAAMMVFRADSPTAGDTISIEIPASKDKPSQSYTYVVAVK